ncbi:hypothetical protein FK220_003735 [Flavobacteriaceae bacterium TP-CH-4]|uniref:Uncharacterized protein n=1 Tax=Pelagihabitans pacificus TaxID=2696054 RepID=A0A967ASJ6_9FLAO|nr:hypothetical protein [Pelagihabitans pacificus]NHF58435.1 hypothetical protein [Pelagihabitans pacificus]
MHIDFPNSIELLTHASENKRYQRLIAQLEKDFVLANVSIDLGLGMRPEDLKATLQEKIYQLIMERFNEYLNLLYVIDVPERFFKEIQVTDVVEVADQVSFLILKRELQKVYLKEKFSA